MSFQPPHIEILLAHVDGPQPISMRDSARFNRVRGLVNHRFLITFPHASRRPTHTALSEAGRHAVAKILASAAEVLIQSGCLEPFPGKLPSEATIYRLIGDSQTKPAKSPKRKTSQKSDNSASSIGRCNPEIDNSLRMTSSADAPASCLAASVNR